MVVVVLLLLLDRPPSCQLPSDRRSSVRLGHSQQVVEGLTPGWDEPSRGTAAPGWVITCACRGGDGGGVSACLGKLWVMGCWAPPKRADRSGDDHDLSLPDTTMGVVQGRRPPSIKHTRGSHDEPPPQSKPETRLAGPRRPRGVCADMSSPPCVRACSSSPHFRCLPSSLTQPGSVGAACGLSDNSQKTMGQNAWP